MTEKGDRDRKTEGERDFKDRDRRESETGVEKVKNREKI